MTGEEFLARSHLRTALHALRSMSSDVENHVTYLDSALTAATRAVVVLRALVVGGNSTAFHPLDLDVYDAAIEFVLAQRRVDNYVRHGVGNGILAADAVRAYQFLDDLVSARVADALYVKPRAPYELATSFKMPRSPVMHGGTYQLVTLDGNPYLVDGEVVTVDLQLGGSFPVAPVPKLRWKFVKT